MAGEYAVPRHATPGFPPQPCDAVANPLYELAGCIRDHDKETEFADSRPWQLEYHLETIRRRRDLGSAANAINDDDFDRSLYRTLQAWEIGVRGSILKPLGTFSGALRERTPEILAFGAPAFGRKAGNLTFRSNRLYSWHLVEGHSHEALPCFW